MSITSDIRSYADSALEQGRHVVGHAQAQFNDAMSGAAKDNVSGLTAKIFATASGAVSELRSQAEKAVDVEALKNAIEPYVDLAKQYQSAFTYTITDRAEAILDSVRNDERLGPLFAVAESVVVNLNELVLRPVTARTGLNSKPRLTLVAAKSAPARTAMATKPATIRPVTTSPVVTPTATTSSATVRPAVRKAAPSKAAPTKAAPTKAAPTKAAPTKTLATKAAAKTGATKAAPTKPAATKAAKTVATKAAPTKAPTKAAAKAAAKKATAKKATPRS